VDEEDDTRTWITHSDLPTFVGSKLAFKTMPNWLVLKVHQSRAQNCGVIEYNNQDKGMTLPSPAR